MAEKEYSIMVHTIQLKPGIGDATSDEVSQGLTIALAQVIQTVGKAAQSLEGGGWDVISHEITRLDRHVVISFLLSRSK
jgi:hypothetical protein